MARLSKQLTKRHEQAVKLVGGKQPLSLDEREFVLNHWSPLANHNVGWAGIFFTPMDIAKELQVETIDAPGKRILDLCAGTGRLAYQAWKKQSVWESQNRSKIVCIERNPEFVKVGQRVLPEATWICADVFEQDTFRNLGCFDEVISNPPFGLHPGSGWLANAPSHYMAAEIAMKIADHAVFVLPQSDLPFAFSGRHYFQSQRNEKYEKFSQSTGVVFGMNCGIDTSVFINEWQGMGKINTEIVLVSKM